MNEVLKALLLRKLAGRGGGGGYPEPTGTKQITANGSGIDVKDYATADVNVPNSYQQGDEGKVVENGALVAQTSRNITENGTVNTTKNNQVVVNVPTGELKEYTSSAIPKNTFKTWANTFNSGSTLTVALAPTDGTVVEVGDEVLVHGEIISSAGGFAYYVTGVVTSFDSSNKPVITVKGLGQPSPIADGLMVISSNGSSDVREYSSVSVNVQGSGTTYITENGTHDVGGYRYANVNVESGGGDVKILFATDAVYTDEPIQGGSCSAEVPTADLSSYSEGDKVVLYGEEPNMTGGNFLVVGTITSFSFPSVVYFDVDEVSEISGGGKGGSDITVLISAMFDADPSSVQSIEVTPMSASDIDALSIGDPVIIQGEGDGSSYVITGTVDDNSGNTIRVLRRRSCFHDGSNIYIDKGGTFVGVPDVGISTTYKWADDSTIYNLYAGAKVMVTGEAGGIMWAAYGECTNVDTSTGEIQINPTISDDFSS